jgi:alcohol dehydrogenase groES domain protein
VSAAAGGVGFLVSQLVRRAGARVIGIASDASAPALEEIGAIPVPYGDGMLQRMRDAAPGGISGLADCFGGGYVKTAIDRGVPPERIKTIIDFEAVQRFGVQMVAMAGVEDPGRVVAELADLVAAGELRVPIRACYPLTEVRAAYDDLASRHGVGKIVLKVDETAPSAAL